MPDTPASRPSRRLDEIFGRDLGTPDDPDPDDSPSDRSNEERAREQWYRENRPPHHDEP